MSEASAPGGLPDPPQERWTWQSSASERLSVEVQIEPAIADAGGLSTPLERLAEASQAAAAEAGFAGQAEMTLVIAADEHVQALNRTYRGVDATTDVLAFGEDGECEEAGQTPVHFVLPAEAEPAYLGDVVISLPQAQRQAAERGHALESELCLLVVHGTLHLLGYEHAGADEQRAMWEAQRRALRRLGREAAAPADVE